MVSGVAATWIEGAELVQTTVNDFCKLAAPPAPLNALSTVPLARASSPSAMVPLIGVMALHFDATVPETLTVPLAVCASAGEAAMTEPAARAARMIFLMTNSISSLDRSSFRRTGRRPPKNACTASAALGERPAACPHSGRNAHRHGQGVGICARDQSAGTGVNGRADAEEGA